MNRNLFYSNMTHTLQNVEFKIVEKWIQWILLEVDSFREGLGIKNADPAVLRVDISEVSKN